MRSLKVLILEDNPFQLMVLHQMLNAFHIFDVLAAEDIESARGSIAKRGIIDVAICDLYLDGASGLELIREMAINHEARAVLTARSITSGAAQLRIIKAREEGLRVLGCLSKPVTVSHLGRLLASYNQSGIAEEAEGTNCLGITGNL